MSNKKIGTKFEKQFLKYLADNEWLAHFLTSDASGAQPFDIIALRDGDVYAIDCKTCSTDTFPLSRIEDNQYWAFRSIIWKADIVCGFAILHNNKIYFVKFNQVLRAQKAGEKSIKLTERMIEDACNCFERNKNRISNS